MGRRLDGAVKPGNLIKPKIFAFNVQTHLWEDFDRIKFKMSGDRVEVGVNSIAMIVHLLKDFRDETDGAMLVLSNTGLQWTWISDWSEIPSLTRSEA